ncbi:MAG TPA: CPBP family glutamic-type intramembrane protease [Myxococcota bacterium]|nr:CPBP family glutamic-type intramembrane protease [Myxococcota bacterium]
MAPDDHEGHGWWPYVAPYVGFLLLSELGARLPEGADPWMLFLKPALTLGLILWFRRQGAYPEWRGEGAQIGVLGGLQDVGVGLALTVVWVAPYLLLPGLRPEPGGAFDPTMAGEALVPLILVLRLFGYAIVTPIFEELFIRSFVMRIADVWESDRDFRDQPIARYSRRSALVTTVVFTLGHVPWEWWVCVPWILLSNLWFYRRKSLGSIMLVHGVTNASLLGLAIWGGELFREPDGSPLSLWFFV